jgi:Rod binding domain-containing protein
MESVQPLLAAPSASLPISVGTDARPHGSPAEVGRQFESIFMSLVIKNLRQTMEGESMFGNDPGDVIGGMFDHYLGDHLGRAGSLGVGHMIRAQLERQAANP